MLLEENKLLELQRFSFENLCENKEQFCSATAMNPDCFMRLFNYLNPGDECSNIRFHDTSKRFSEEKYTNSEKVRSGPKPKISAKEQLLMYSTWLKNGFILSYVSFLFQTPKIHCFKIYYYLEKFFILFSWLDNYLFGLHVSKSTKKCQKYLKEHTPLLDAY